jgi:hypothetical protein
VYFFQQRSINNIEWAAVRKKLINSDQYYKHKEKRIFHLNINQIVGDEDNNEIMRQQI